jgi:phospholipid-binding lipoprotein MlaA
MKIHKYTYLPLQVLVLVVLAFLLSSCSSKQVTSGQELQVEPAKRPISEYVNKDQEYVLDRIYDPWEPFNRRMYRFNYHFDKYVFLPLVKVYSFILPDFAKTGVSNFFDNVREIKNFYNNVLQLQGKASVNTVVRFGINTTIGLLGVWDPATRMGIREHPEDFGQTLGHYGVGNGPFVVWPIFGPSNLRDTTGLVADGVAMNLIIYDLILDEGLEVSDDSQNDIKLAATILNALDTRYRTGFRYYGTGSPFEYELVKLFYTEKRDLDINKH